MNARQIFYLILLALPILFYSKRLPRFAIEKPISLLMIVLALALFGAGALIFLPVELMPNVAYGNVTIFIDVRGGMPPPEIERLITKPVEESMGTVTRLRNLISSSKKDRSVVTLEFDPGTDMDIAALEVREKFLRVKPKLPPEIEKPVIARYEESDAPIYIAAFTSDHHSPEILRHWVDSQLKEKLMRITGVANVEVSGGRERKIVVNLDRNRLAAYGISIKQVVNVLERNNINIQTGELQSGPFLNVGIRTLGAFRSVDEIRNMTIAVLPQAGRVRLFQVGSVEDSFLEQESFSRLNARSAVMIYIQKETTANVVKTTEKIESVFQALQPSLPRGTEMVVISNQKKAILNAINSVRTTLLYGIILVVLILSAFFAKTTCTQTFSIGLICVLILNVLVCYLFRWNMDWTSGWLVGLCLLLMIAALLRRDMRLAMSVAISIPTSVAITLALMYLEKISINVMSLSGLILGIGLLVDNAVVVVENYDRKMHLAQKELRDANAPPDPPEFLDLKPQTSRAEIMIEAAEQMTPSILAGTLTTIVVFLPFSLLHKQAQVLFSGISFAVTASLIASLFTSLTVVPALALLSDPTAKARSAIDDQFEAWMARLDLKGKVKFFRLAVFKLGEKIQARIGLAKILAVAAILAVGLLKIILDIPLLQGGFILAALLAIGAGIWGIQNYSRSFAYCFHHRKQLYGGVAVLALAAFLIFIFVLPKDFLNSSEQSEFVIFVELDTGVRLDLSNKVVSEIEQKVRDFPATKNEIKTLSSKVEGWSSKIYVTLNDFSQRSLSTQEVINQLRPVVNQTIEPYAEEYKGFCYFSEPRSGKEIFVEIFGYEYDLLAKIAMEIASQMGKISSLSDVKIRYRPGRPQMTVQVDPLQAAPFGLDAKEIADTLHAQMRGLRATTFYDESAEVETIVRLDPEQRKTIQDLKQLLFLSSLRRWVPLDQVAQIKGDLSPSEIWHRNKSRMIQVSANLGNSSLETAAQEVRKIFPQISFPSEYYADIGGQYEDMVEANRSFWKALILTLFLIFAVMACQFESLTQPWIIMSTVVLSSIGAVTALSFSQTPVTLGVFVGLLMMGGIAVNNGIMLIDRIHILQQLYPELPRQTLLKRATKERMRPIFMTTSTTLLGLVPMAFDRSESANLWSPLAITVMGGMVSSTILTLFVVPCVYETVLSSIEKVQRLYQAGGVSQLWAAFKNKISSKRFFSATIHD